MILSLESLKTTFFSLSDIDAFLRRPSYRELIVENRGVNGFMYVKNGKCRYDFAGQSFEMEAGSLVYLPYGSCHRMTVLSEDISFYCVNFILTVSGEVALFSDCPVKLTDRLSPEVAESISAMETEHSTVVKTEKLCFLLSALGKSATSPRAEKLYPAVTYIHEHLTEPFSSQILAERCYLSSAQFYNLFLAEYEITPLMYRNRLILSRAEALLMQEGITVSEVAESLGFESNAYFSRFFKKHKGISPSEYIKHQ